MNPGPASGLAYFTPGYHTYDAIPTEIQAMNNALYFWGTNDSSGLKLWKSDGSAGGTIPVNAVPKYSPGHGNLCLFPFGNKIIMPAGDGGTWITDGTNTGTYRLFSANGDSLLVENQVTNYQFFAYGNKVYFTTNSTLGLWVSDGTSAGTILDTFPSSLYIALPTLAGKGSVYLSAYMYGDARPYQVWKLDTLTLQGTMLFADTNRSSPVIMYDSLLVISAGSPVNTAEPNKYWTSNGTTNGLNFMASIYFGQRYSSIVYNHHLYIPGYDSTFSNAYIFKSDGTPSGTQPCLIYSGNTGALYSTQPTVFNNKIIYDGNIGSSEMELWEAEDGFCIGNMLNPISQQTHNYAPGGFFNLNDVLLFNATDDVHGTSLWKLDTTMLTQNAMPQANHFKIFPNPALNYLDIQGELTSVKILDLEGRKLLDQRIYGYTSFIDISAFLPGVYFVQTFNEENLYIGTAKFIKQ